MLTSSAALEDLFNNLRIHDLESRVLITSVVRLVTPAHHGSPTNSQATAVEDGFEVLSSPGPHMEDDDGDDNDSDASEMVTPQVTVTNSPAAMVIPPPVVTTSIAVAPNAVGPAAIAIGLPALYIPGYALPSNRPDNAILPPANLITPIYGYHTPSPNSGGPFFCVSRGRDIGIFCGW